ALSQGLASNTGIANSFDQDVAAKYKNQLKDFLSDEKKESAFSYSDMENISNKLSIPNASLKDLLVRKGLVSDLSKKPINPYLEKIGKRTAESRITTALFGSIGITVAGIKIDASDIFDLLSGNGTSVGDKIGSKYMEKQLGTGDNQIINVVQSPSSIIRNCSMANLGANFVGGVLGLGTVSLSGNFYENIGGAKIEKVLNLPSNSFRGGNLNDLMNNVGPVAFARAFELPPANVISSDILSDLSMKSSTKQHSISDQYKLVESKINYLDKNNSSLGSATKINSKLKQNINNLLASNFTNSAPNPYTSDSSTKSVSDFQVANSLSRVNSIDNQFGLPLGITSQLLTGKISPDDYRHLVADTVVTSIPTINNLGGLLGIDPATLTRVDAVANLAQQINFCKFDSCNYTKMYQGFSQIFGLKLDHKLGLRDGSIGQIIASPEKAAATMLLSALNKLDNSLDLNSAGDASFTAAYAGLGGPLPYSDDWRNNTPMKFRETDTITTGGGGFIGGSAHSSDRWQYYGGKIGTQLVGKFLNRIGIIATPSPGSGSYVGKPETQNLILDSTEKLVHGDLRVLEVTAAVKAAEALHFYSDDQGNSKKLPEYYRVSFEDIYYSIMGDPIFEQSYIDKATDNFLSSYQTNDGNPNPNLTPLSSITEDGEMAGSPTDTLYGSQCPPGFTGDDCYLVNPMGPNNSYSTYENLESMANDNASAYPTTAYDPAAVMQSIQSNPEATEALAQTQESARRQADDTLHSNLLWRMADAKLYQVDNNIPAGFIKTMYSGNGVQRTIMIVDYLQNALHNVSINGVIFDKAEMGIDIYNQITSFMQDPQSFDLDSLLKNGDLDKFNNWASGKLGNLLGFNLQPGTITSVLYGFKSGSFTNDITVPGVGDQVKSLTTIYKDWAIGKITGWADKALGLPSGSVFTAYSMYRNYAAAREALFAAKNFGSAADVTNARANLDSIKASAIAFVVNLVFSKQIGQFENAIGLVPGTGSMLVTMLISGFNPVSVAIFVLMNLFGVYKTVITCTADGYYPRIDQKPDPTVSDNSSLGTFSGLNPTAKKAGYIQAAQYKNRTLIGDVLSLSERIGDQTAIPSQIMTGRQEDVDYWQYKVDDVICSKVGGCAGTRAGLWVNPQTTGYLHIGF
ncbi:hypothetical protein COT12_03270, partial [Candidatus Berkelbacteria bacterium CG08_land_8_20_14_0_20_39_8]